MPNFAYTALDSTGKTVKGSLAVRSKMEAYRELERQSLHPVTVREEAEHAGGGAASKKASASSKGPVRLKRTLLILFTSELADLLDAGLQLEQALRIMEERQDDASIKRVSAILREEIREGAKFSKALKKASPSFDELYINLIAAGEAGGALPDILRRLAINLQVMHDLQTRVVSAMIYPAFLIGFCILLIFVFSTVLMPQLTSLMTMTNRDLPLLTQLLMTFSEFMAKWWWVILAAFVAIGLLLKAYTASPQGRRWWDQFKLGFPLFGPVITARYYAQFCQSLGNLVNNGVPLLNGLKLMGRATPNVYLRGLMEQVVVRVQEGASLSGTMRKLNAFPPMMVDILGIGEQTGKIGNALVKAAARYDKELTVRIDRLTKMISPIVLIAMALVVGVVAYAIITTLFESANSIRQT